MVVGGATHMMRLGFQRLMEAMLDCEKPIIVALNGTAAGGGWMFVLAADLVIAADTAKIIQVFVRRGLVPDGGVAYLLPPRRGHAQGEGAHLLRRRSLRGRRGTHRDRQQGRARRRVGAAAKEWAERLAGGPTKAIGWAKRLLHDASELRRENLLQEEAMYVELNSHTQDSGEGVASFRERRAAGVEGLVSRDERSSSRTRRPSSASGRRRSARACPTPSCRWRARRSRSRSTTPASRLRKSTGSRRTRSSRTARSTSPAAVGLGDITFFSQVGFGGGAGCGVVGHTAMAVATGQCEVVVAWRARKRASAASRPWAQASAATRRRSAVDAAVRDPPPGRRDRDAHPSLHARVRRHARSPRQRRDRVPQARGAQSRCRRWATSR